jgi:hypothetical protein
MAVSPRRDLAASYARLITEIRKYLDDGTKIMIKNGWFFGTKYAIREMLKTG